MDKEMMSNLLPTTSNKKRKNMNYRQLFDSFINARREKTNIVPFTDSVVFTTTVDLDVFYDLGEPHQIWAVRNIKFGRRL